MTATTLWHDVEVDGDLVRVMEAGDPCAEPLLFLHGWGLSPACYADGIARLSTAGVRVVAPCLPGFGGSDGPSLRSVDLPTYAARVGRLLDVLGESGPLFVAGHSFGGGVALQLATDRPELVRSLTLVNSVGGAPPRTPLSPRGLVDASWLRWALGATTELSPRHVAASAPSLLRAFVPNLLRRPLTLALTARLALQASLAEQSEALVRAGLPVLFVWGDEDRLIARGALGAVVAQLPAEVVHGRHGWLFTQPEQFGDLLCNALVVHALLERGSRPAGVPGRAVPAPALRLPTGTTLRDLLPDAVVLR